MLSSSDVNTRIPAVYTHLEDNLHECTLHCTESHQLSKSDIHNVLTDTSEHVIEVKPPGLTVCVHDASIGTVVFEERNSQRSVDPVLLNLWLVQLLWGDETRTSMVSDTSPIETSVVIPPEQGVFTWEVILNKV